MDVVGTITEIRRVKKRVLLLPISLHPYPRFLISCLAINGIAP